MTEGAAILTPDPQAFYSMQSRPLERQRLKSLHLHEGQRCKVTIKLRFREPFDAQPALPEQLGADRADGLVLKRCRLLLEPVVVAEVCPNLLGAAVTDG